MKKTLLLSLVVAGLVFSGCSSKEANVRQERVQNFNKMYADLPEWATKDTSSFSAVGSAINRGQSFSHLRAEAIMLAKASLVQKISSKVDSMEKSYYGTAGLGKDSELEEVTKTSSMSLASQTLNGVIVTNTYVSEGGELFVEVTLNPESFEKFLKSNYKSQANLYQSLQADKEWKELKEEVSKLPQNAK